MTLQTDVCAGGHAPRKRFGQHFLTDPGILGRIADAVGAGPDDTVLEIGPGRGALTDLLVERAGRVVAIEGIVEEVAERIVAAINDAGTVVGATAPTGT